MALAVVEDLSVAQAEWVDVEIDGRLIEFSRWPNGADYENDASSVANLGIWECIEALEADSRKRPRVVNARGELASIDLWIDLDREKLFPWETNVLGIAFNYHARGKWTAEFMLNTAIGMQPHAIKEAVSSIVQGSGFSLDGLEGVNERPILEQDGWHQWVCWITDFPTAARFIDLFRLRDRISQATFLLQDVIATPYLALRMIQLGQAQALIGMQETEWFEVKSSPYELKNVDDSLWKHELAEDVAQFANTEAGGILLIGFHTKRKSGVGTIDKITPIPTSQNRLQIYRDVLRHRIHPPISGLLIETFSWGSGQIACVFIPPQRSGQQPYLVSGTVVGGRYLRAGVTIVRRQGDASIPITAQEIHSTLVAGHAFLRGEKRIELSNLQAGYRAFRIRLDSRFLRTYRNLTKSTSAFMPDSACQCIHALFQFIDVNPSPAKLDPPGSFPIVPPVPHTRSISGRRLAHGNRSASLDPANWVEAR